MSSGYGNYQGHDRGGDSPSYYNTYGDYQLQDEYGTYTPYQSGSGHGQPASYDQSYINRAQGMNPFYTNPMQTQWQMMQHYYSTDAYSGGGGSSNGGYRAGGGQQYGQYGGYSGDDQYPRYHDQDRSHSHRRHKNKDSRQSTSQGQSRRPHISSPYMKMPSPPPRHHRNSSPPSSSPGPPPPSSPSPSYLELSAASSEPLSSPGTSRKLLILDLNGTLVLRSTRPHGKTTYDSRQRAAPRSVYPRPYMGAFREWMFHEKNREWLDVMVWSSAQPHSVDDMVQKAFGEDGKELLKAVWARDKMGLGADAYYQKVQTVKDLTKPWTELASLPSSSSNPASPVVHSAMTTLLLDDSFKKAILQPYNHVIIKEYTREMRNADVASLALETRRAQRAVSASTKDKDDVEAQSESIASSTSPPPEATSGVFVFVNEGPEVEGELSAKQKKKKKTKKARQTLDREEGEGVGEEEGEVVYDETLLAIIGIFNEAKVQSNVAAWVRSGGLWGPYASSMHEHQRRDKKSGSRSEGDTNSGSPKRKGRPEKREDVVNPGNGEPTYVPLGEESEAKMEDGPPVWYEHPGTMIYWSVKGRDALTELGIEIRHGL
ncbi:uncharacterized protein STEHIDRAFT_150391 [Stereum hirsutum FP-91666 SS1]|uniref:uncharacterized protein n=1 Tax=Stereum hirsutum (strain FP-91666) TaxID=721885 RepID=UPI00044494FE|nr:uncharacterized protein STEHIDRAFT_150391 [Stereum hirsutum FP-91666 SS1]EIM80686.1 hypothetical protein STEHIDRAFT_150391 [Stereum hirsutum FP-91666 SS1]